MRVVLQTPRQVSGPVAERVNYLISYVNQLVQNLNFVFSDEAPTMEQFNQLQEKVNQLENRVNELENGGA